MDENNISKIILSGVSINDIEIRTIIKAFSAYLDKFDSEYHYNYKYLPSHLEDFCKANNVLPKFLKTCEEFIDLLLINTVFKEFIHQINANNEMIELTLVFNKSIQYNLMSGSIINSTEKTILEVPNKCCWINKDYIDIDLRIDFVYREFHFTKNMYGVTKENMLRLCIDFMNKCYKIIVEKYVVKNWIEILKSMIAVEEYEVFISDYFVLYPLKYQSVETFFTDGALEFKKGKKDIFLVHYNGCEKEISLQKDNAEIVEELKKFVGENREAHYGE